MGEERRPFLTIRKLKISHRLLLLALLTLLFVGSFVFYHLSHEVRQYERQQEQLNGLSLIEPTFAAQHNLLKVRDAVNLYLELKAWGRTERPGLPMDIEQSEKTLSRLFKEIEGRLHSFHGKEHMERHTQRVELIDKLYQHAVLRWERLFGKWKTVQADKQEQDSPKPISKELNPEINELEEELRESPLNGEESIESQVGMSDLKQYNREVEQLISDLSTLLVEEAEESHNLANAVLEIQYLTRLMIENLPATALSVSAARRYGSAVLVKKGMNYRERHELSFHYGEMVLLAGEIDLILKKIYRHSPHLKIALGSAFGQFKSRLYNFSESMEMLLNIEEEVNPALDLMGVSTVFSEGEDALDAIYQLNHQVVRTLEQIVSQRLEELRREVFVTLLLTLMLLAVITLGGVLLIRSITRPIQELVSVMGNFTKNGDYSGRIGDSCQDEIGKMADSFNIMADSIEKQNRALSESNQQIEKAGRAKDEFLASMSHELRTPLTAIIGNCDYLLEQEVSREILLCIKDIHAAGRSQLALVNDILDMSKIEAGKFAIDEVEFDLSQLLGEVESMLAIRAEDAGNRLLVELAGEYPCYLRGDPQRIAQILINLLGNAVKFTLNGEVSLKVWSETDALFFEVKDSGIGMSAEVVERLFKPFEQADGSISKRFGGTGLGLYISHNLAHLMGGTIAVSSVEGQGSIFTLQIPCQVSDRQIEHEMNGGKGSAVEHERFSGRVLIAEDTLQLQMLERRMLEGMGLTVSIANNGKEAIEWVGRESFDLILMDMQMPEMDGIEATQLMRKMRITTPIVPLTANVMQRHREQFIELGCEAFLEKPIDKQELRAVLSKYLSSAEGRAEPMAVGDELMQYFYEKAESSVTELERAVTQQDWEKIHDVAHVMKGGGAPFGFPDISAQGARIQELIEREELVEVPQLATRLAQELERIVSASNS